MVLSSPALAHAQLTTFQFETATPSDGTTYAVVEETADNITLVVESDDTDWQASDINGFAGMQGHAAYTPVTTSSAVLTFNRPVNVASLRCATFAEGETWTFTTPDGASVTAAVSATAMTVDLGFVNVTRITVTSSAGAFLPIFDDVAAEEAQPVDVDDAAQTPAALTLDVHGTVAQQHISGVLNTPFGAGQVQLYDALGRKVARVQNVSGAFALDTQHLAPGVYVLRAEAHEHVVTRTIVVAR